MSDELFAFAGALAHDKANDSEWKEADESGGDGDFEAGVDAGTVVDESLEGISHDLRSGDVEGFLDGELGGGGASGGVTEAGFDRAGADCEDTHTLGAKFESKGFAEAGDVSFGGGVNREIRDGKIASQ